MSLTIEEKTLTEIPFHWMNTQEIHTQAQKVAKYYLLKNNENFLENVLPKKDHLSFFSWLGITYYNLIACNTDDLYFHIEDDIYTIVFDFKNDQEPLYITSLPLNIKQATVFLDTLTYLRSLTNHSKVKIHPSNYLYKEL